MLVEVNDDILLELLMERVKVWTKDDGDETRYNLFKKMYENLIDAGVFSKDFNVDVIVDDDVINWCSVIDKSDAVYNVVKKAYNNGEYDISRLEGNDGISYIEAEENGAFLCRY